MHLHVWKSLHKKLTLQFSRRLNCNAECAQNAENSVLARADLAKSRRRAILTSRHRRQNSYRRTAALSCLLAVSLTAAGCGGQEAAVNREMGRYVEDFFESSAELGRYGAFTRLDDGSLALFSYNYGPFLSKDEGKTWEPWQGEWFAEIGSMNSVRCAAIAPDGTIFLEMLNYGDVPDSAEASDEEEQGDDEEGETQETESEDEGGRVDAAISFDMRYQLVRPDGSAEDIVLDGFSGKDGDDFIDDLWYAPDGTLYASGSEQLYEVIPADGALRSVLEADRKIEQVVFNGDDLIAATTQGAVIYDRAQKTQKESDSVLDEFLKEKAAANGSNQLKYTSGSYNVYLHAADDMLYLVCDEGIYAHKPGGGTMEKLLEGSLYTLGDPSQSVFGMMKTEGESFLVMYMNAAGIFTYDETMPTLPDKELWVYSMNKDDMVQQAVSRFQKEHPDVYVRYEMGLAENSGQTKEDVIKNLNTLILAGKGPDVLILDDLPMKSYQEKGMLLDLSGLLAEIKKDEKLFDNIAGVFGEGEKLYAIPGRCYIPVMIGPKDAVDQASDLKGLSQAIQDLRTKKTEGTVMGGVLPWNTLKLLSLSSAPAWEKKDGSMDEEAVEEFLKAAKSAYDAETSGITQQEIDDFADMNIGLSRGNGGKSSIITDEAWQLIDINAQNVYFGAQSLGIGYMQEIWSANLMFSAKKQKENLECALLPGQSGNVFAPFSIIGISASSKERELSEAFVRKFLSSDVDGGSGFYTNRTVQESKLYHQDVEPGEVFGSMLTTNSEGFVMQMDIYQFTETEADWLLKTMESLDTPYVPGSILEKAVLDTGEKVLKGEMDVTEAMDEIESLVKLAMAE